MTVAAHTWDHHGADRYHGTDWRIQPNRPRPLLEHLTGAPVQHFAYPYGPWSARDSPPTRRRIHHRLATRRPHRPPAPPLHPPTNPGPLHRHTPPAPRCWPTPADFQPRTPRPLLAADEQRPPSLMAHVSCTGPSAACTTRRAGSPARPGVPRLAATSRGENRTCRAHLQGTSAGSAVSVFGHPRSLQRPGAAATP